jgi:hypothetical protein
MADFALTYRDEQPKCVDGSKGKNFCCDQIKENYGPLLILSFQFVGHVVQKIFDLESLD